MFCEGLCIHEQAKIDQKWTKDYLLVHLLDISQVPEKQNNRCVFFNLKAVGHSSQHCSSEMSSKIQKSISQLLTVLLYTKLCAFVVHLIAIRLVHRRVMGRVAVK